MNSLSNRRPVRWVSSYEITEADQPVAPVRGILKTLRSNQWLVLSRRMGEQANEYFPFRKRELSERFADAAPFALASEVLNLPERGAEALTKRIWSTSWDSKQNLQSSRMVWIDEEGTLLGIGVPKEERARPEIIASYLKSAIEVELMSETRFLKDADEGKEKPEKSKANAIPSLIVPVFYGTDRKREPNASADDTRYTNERAPDEKVSLGVCSVSIPKVHELGKLERPSKWKFWSRLKPSQHVMLLSTTELVDHAFWERLKASVAESAKRDAFIFVHGYNVSFEDAALRTAQLATDLSFQGGPIMFSWPSKGTLAGYLSDEGTIHWSRPHLRKFIEDVCSSTEANAVHLIAHSMGSRALVEVVHALTTAAIPANTLKQLIFAAPDVDSGVFLQAAQSLSNTCSRVTLYASDNDKALNFSKTIHDYGRAGEAGTGLIVAAGVDTVDASLVDTDFLGHSGFATARSLMQDVYSLIQHGHQPNERFGLSQKSCDLGTYWCFKT